MSDHVDVDGVGGAVVLCVVDEVHVLVIAAVAPVGAGVTEEIHGCLNVTITEVENTFDKAVKSAYVGSMEAISTSVPSDVTL